MDVSFSLVVVASCPPPVVGQTIATAMLLRRLDHDRVPYRFVDLSYPLRFRNSLHRAFLHGRRAVALPLQVLLAVRRLPADRARILYLQLGHGGRALVRDAVLIAIALQSGLRVVAHVHGSGVRQSIDKMAAPVRELVESVLGRLDRAVVLSPLLRDQLLGVLPAARIAVVPNGVETTLTEDAARRADEVVERWRRRARGESTDSDSPLKVLFLSNLHVAKGYEVVLNAALLAQSMGVPAKFLIAGDLPSDAGVDPRRFICDHDLRNVIYCGPVHGRAKFELFASADVFVLPSEYEGQPICILEAMHYGLPIVATHVGGIPDVVADGVNGRFVKPQDPSGLLIAIESLVNAPATTHRMSESNREKARTHYSEEAHGAALLSVVRQLAAEP